MTAPPPDLRTLYLVVQRFNAHPETDAVYFDLDYLAPAGGRQRPYFAPGWSPDLLLSAPYIVHLVVRRSCLAAVGGLRSECDGGQDYDLALRLAEVTDKIAHVPELLYHWRVWSGSAAMNPDGNPMRLPPASWQSATHCVAAVSSASALTVSDPISTASASPCMALH